MKLDENSRNLLIFLISFFRKLLEYSTENGLKPEIIG